MLSSKNNELEQVINEIIRKEEPETVEQLIALIKLQENLSEEQIIKALESMQSEDLIEFHSKSNALPGFKNYLLSVDAVWYWLTLLIVFLTFISIFIIPDFPVWALVKKTFAGLSVFLLPGYTMTNTFFKGKRAATKIDPLLKTKFIFFSLVISLVFIPLAALLLSFSPFGVTLVLIVIVSLFSSTLFATIGVVIDYSKKRRQEKSAKAK
jgi:hypothetical protein